MSLSILAFLLSLIPVKMEDHAIYIAVIEIVHGAGDKKADMQVKVFSDDLRDVIKNYAEENQLEYMTDSLSQIELLTAYFKDNLKVSTNRDDHLKWILSCRKEEGDATFLFFKTVSPEAWNVLVIEAPLFTEVFPSQVNMLKIEIAEQKYFGKTSSNSTQYEISLN